MIKKINNFRDTYSPNIGLVGVNNIKNKIKF